MRQFTSWGCQILQIASQSATPVSAPLDLLDGVAHTAEQQSLCSSLTCCRAFSYPGPTQSLQLFKSLGDQGNITHPNEEYASSKIWRGPLRCCTSVGCERGQMPQVILHFRRNISMCPTPLYLWNFTDRLWTLVRFISHSLTHKCFTNKNQCLGTSLVVQWLRIHLPIQGTHSVPGWGTEILITSGQLSQCPETREACS